MMWKSGKRKRQTGGCRGIRNQKSSKGSDGANVQIMDCVGKNLEQHRFLSHFILIQFDFISEGATAPSDAINRIKNCLAPIDGIKAPLVWSRIVQLARTSAGKSGQFDRARLVRSISPIARLAGAASFIPLFDKLVELAKSYANLISDNSRPNIAEYLLIHKCLA